MPQKTTRSQKQLAHWAVDVMVEFYACLFSSSLMCNLWTPKMNVYLVECTRNHLDGTEQNMSFKIELLVGIYRTKNIVRQWNFPRIRGIPRISPNFWSSLRSVQIWGETWKSVLGGRGILGTIWVTDVVHLSKSAQFCQEFFGNVFITVSPSHIVQI